MRLGVQMGHGMKSLAREYLEVTGSRSPIVLSPRNVRGRDGIPPEKRLAAFAGDPAIGGSSDALMVDPQLFSAKSATENLRSFSYWRACQDDFPKNREAVMEELASLNRQCGTSLFVIPSETTDAVDARWARDQAGLAELGRRFSGGRPTLLTVALGSAALRGDFAVDALALAAESWDTDGIYLVCEHPKGEYLVDRPLWLYDIMRVCAGAKRAGKLVYFGYGSHQMLALALAGCDCLLSGNFLNVRRFDRTTFEQGDAADVSRRAKWYYAPQALSEFKLTTLDLAYGQGAEVLDHLRSPYGDDEYTGMLFSGVMPSDTGYSERDSFMHYLISVGRQCEQVSQGTYDDTLATLNQGLSTAQLLVDGLSERGIGDRDRNFAEALPATAQAVAAFNKNWGFAMRREWGSIIS